MPEHRIRLRGAWDLVTTDGATWRRVDLPTLWGGDEAVGPIRLARRFGRPRAESLAGSILLELADVPGLAGVRLNGRALGPIPGRFAVGDLLLARNRLELDVDLAGADRGVAWGTIALVVVDPTAGTGPARGVGIRRDPA